MVADRAARVRVSEVEILTWVECGIEAGSIAMAFLSDVGRNDTRTGMAMDDVDTTQTYGD